ncbi:ubiquitin-40S ribosomal protein S27a isoform X2 [Galendromus occidentalis]|uniref:Ubiquitin-40S ribosomal protein S27a isoform X2 n=1 Tax=Galendromus occidentalis TaxID=34638 RepID=A0AAJ7L5D4_9ACAR|nr:ubiquitin-40S ribosomal protein S27a isoform X2 [Galendromus occidentalis]XP_018494648.1 ubiquitin-40S ribosomal protein S27a isoform X2 [Galendromus occidentalis]
MQLFVKTLTGTQTFNLQSSALVSDVKNAIEASGGIPSSDQLLTLSGKLLDDASTLLESGVTDDSCLYLSLRLLGGAKKRKKKNYTTPKKNKHKKKKVKLAVLKFYKVDDTGKITRLRRECNDCGAGVFMASHQNRHYCGKCSLTFVYEKTEGK